MKKLLLPSFILLTTLLYFGCSKTLYTADIAKGCQTKDQVVKQFGVPDKIAKVGADQEWTYNGDMKPAVKQLPKDSASAQAINDSLKIAQYINQSKYIKFMIDTNNNVTGYKINGVNSSKKVKVSAGEVFLKVLGNQVVITLLVAVAIGLTSKG